MPGYVSTAFDFIEDLRRNLRDRYKDCHAVLKELLQNADDAGATRVEVAWAERVEGLAHPLLQGPLLFVYNDAPFSFKDALAIHRQGIGTKGHDRRKIGKFGLGLKSVFHLCEAFLYLSDEAGDAAARPAEMPAEIRRTGILNPWDDAKKPRYPVWEQFTQGSPDERVLRQFIAERFRGGDERWFCLAVPLRQRSHCCQVGGDNPDKWAIEPRYHGDTPEPPAELFCDRRIGDARGALPLLTSVNVIHFWRLGPTDRSGSPVAPVATIERKPSATANWRSSVSGRHVISGSVTVSVERSTVASRYAGVEELLEVEALAALRNCEGWPYSNAQTDQGIVREPAVACQHAAVVLADAPARAGEASLRWQKAVFLPLGKHEEMAGGAVCDKQFRILLHGYFFVDAGRLDADLAEDGDEPTVSQQVEPHPSHARHAASHRPGPGRVRPV